MQKFVSYIRNNPGMVIILVVAVLMGWNTLGVIQRNYEHQQRVDELNSEIALLELENEQLGYNIEYYKTDAYLEQRARESLSLRAPGESVIIVPKREPIEEAQPENAEDITRWEQTKQNVQDWIDLFSGRARSE